MEEKIVKLGDELLSLTTAEAIELQKYLESKGLVMAQATVVATVEAKPEEKKESEFVNIVLTKTGGLVKLAKALMPRTGKNAAGIKELTQNIPAVVMEKVPREQAKATISELANELNPDEFTFELQDC